MSECGDVEDVIVCSLCKKQELDSSKVIECSVCHNSMHFKCKRIFGNGIQKTRQQATFICSPGCAEMHSRLNEQPGFEKLITELNAAVRLSIREEMDLMNTKLEASQQSMMNEFHAFTRRFEEIRLENEDLKRTVATMTEKYNSLLDMVFNLETEVDKTSRCAIEKNAVVLGLPMMEGEDTMGLVRKLCSSISCSLPENSVVSAKRMIAKDGKTGIPPIKVVFADAESKEQFFASKKQHGKISSTSVNGILVNGKSTNVVVRDELSPLGVSLLKELRGMQEALEIKYVWPGRRGVILLKRSDGGRVEMVRNRRDIVRVEQKFAKRALSQFSPDNSSTSDVEPPGKRTCN